MITMRAIQENTVGNQLQPDRPVTSATVAYRSGDPCGRRRC
jgi:hypothetical protein